MYTANLQLVNHINYFCTSVGTGSVQTGHDMEKGLFMTRMEHLLLLLCLVVVELLSYMGYFLFLDRVLYRTLEGKLFSIGHAFLANRAVVPR